MFDTAIGVEIAFTLAKILVMVVIALQVAPIMVWVERRQCAYIQRRIGPNRVGLFGFKILGLGQPLADTVKLLFKEDYIPREANKLYYLMAPILPATFAMAAISGIPIGRYVEIAGQTFSLQPISLNAGFLFFFAMSSLSVYGVALAGWASNNKYALLGGLRASAQMISYEIAMGLSLLPLVFIFNSIDTQTIISEQSSHLLFGFLPAWGVFYAPVSFVIFIITMFAETNRLPFDLAEGEAELVAGFLVEYGSMRWSLFFLGEYAMMFTLSALMVCLFLGGYEIPWLPQSTIVNALSGPLGHSGALWAGAGISFATLIAKVAVMMFVFVQVRFTLPRFRYDQLMRIGWVYLLPIAIANVAITALIVALLRF